MEGESDEEERKKEDTPCLVVGCFMFNISFDGNSL